MSEKSLCLVVLLDDLETVFNRENLHHHDFYSAFRAVVQHPSHGIRLICVSKFSLSDVNHRLKQEVGSQYFNHLAEIVLTPLEAREIGALLQGDKYFSQDERVWLYDLCGGHPFLLRRAAAILYDLHQDKRIKPQAYKVSLVNKLLQQISGDLDGIFNAWDDKTQIAFTVIALENLSFWLNQDPQPKFPQILARVQQYHVSALLEKLSGHSLQIRSLEKRGYLRENTDFKSGWQVVPQIFLFWLPEKLAQQPKPGENSPQTVISLHQWDGLLTRGEKAELIKAAQTLGTWLQKGANIFTESLLKAFAEKLISG